MEDQWKKLLMELFADATLKDRFKEDPAAFLRSRGIDVPAGVTVKALEDTASVHHLVIPFMDSADEALSEELEQRLSKRSSAIFIA